MPGPVTERQDQRPDAVGGRFGARWRARLDRVGPLGSIRREVPLALTVTVLTATLLAFNLDHTLPVPGQPVDPKVGWTLGSIACVQSLVLVLRRRYPLACFATVVALQLVLVGLPWFTIRGPALVVAAYTIGTLWSRWRAHLAAGLAVVAELVLRLPVDFVGTPDLLRSTVNGAVQALAVYTLPVLAGAAMATRRRYTELVAERAADAVAAQQASARAAVVAERTRMARELHDVAAHHLSGIVVQAAAVERLVERDPSAARAGAAWIRTQGRQTLDNLRLTVGVLREASGAAEDSEGAAPAERTPTPGLGSLEELVRAARELGTPVTLERRGAPRELAPLADIACFRVAQEALSNARQHAPGAEVTVLLEFATEEVRLEVTDTGPQRPRPRRTGTGVGLIGMRERAELIGAQFSAGPGASGGWRVELRIPVAEVDRAPVPSAGEEQVL